MHNMIWRRVIIVCVYQHHWSTFQVCLIFRTVGRNSESLMCVFSNREVNYSLEMDFWFFQIGSRKFGRDPFLHFLTNSCCLLSFLLCLTLFLGSHHSVLLANSWLHSGIISGVLRNPYRVAKIKPRSVGACVDTAQW